MKFRVPYLSPLDSKSSRASDSSKPDSTEKSPQQVNLSERDYDSGRERNFPTLTGSVAADTAAIPVSVGIGDETTDTHAAFSTCRTAGTCADCACGPLEMHSDAHSEELMMPAEAASWLHTLGDYEGYWLVEWVRAGDEFPIQLVVGEGRVFYGVARQCLPWTDDVLARRSPAFIDAYREYRERRRAHPVAVSMFDLLVDLDELPVDGRQRQALIEHLARMLSPGTKGKGKRWRLDSARFEDHEYLSFDPSEVMVAIGQQMCPIDGLVEELERLNIEPEEAWLFSRGEAEGDRLICSMQPLRNSIDRLQEISARAVTMLRTSAMTPDADEPLTRAIGVSEDDVWMCVADDESVALSRHPMAHLGRLFRLVEGVG